MGTKIITNVGSITRRDIIFSLKIYAGKWFQYNIKCIEYTVKKNVCYDKQYCTIKDLKYNNFFIVYIKVI